MNRYEVLTAYDEQIRRRSDGHGPGAQVEREDGIVRVVAAGDAWMGVTWSDLDDVSADAAIAAQIDRFAGLSRRWEWKHYSYDRPPDLPERLLEAGFSREPAEALLVAATADLDLEVPPPAGVRLLPVDDEWGIDAVIRVHDEVFGGDHSAIGKALAAQLGRAPTAGAAVVAVAGRTPIAAGRVEFTTGTDFASLWGGGTLAGWRGRGVFRSLVAYRAALAAAAGFRYLQVDASADSRPILRRLDFVELATTTPFGYPGGAG